MPRILNWVITPVLVLAAAPALAGLHWYNGDPDFGVYQVGVSQTGFAGTVLAYDDFEVTSDINVTTVFGNFVADPGTNDAYWEIREGMGPGTAGTLVASGFNTAGQLPSGFDLTPATGVLYAVNNLSVHLTAGTYWLTLAPVGLYGDLFGTTGANAAGAVGGAANSLVYSPDIPIDYVNLGPDFSYGVLSGAIPAPDSMLLAGLGLGGSIFVFRLNRR